VWTLAFAFIVAADLMMIYLPNLPIATSLHGLSCIRRI
jgi:hypothetical protein